MIIVIVLRKITEPTPNWCGRCFLLQKGTIKRTRIEANGCIFVLRTGGMVLRDMGME